jgi:CBS domain containing-hemolysin-like protein
MEQYLLIIVVSLLFSALFSGIEIAFVSSNKLQMGLQANQGSVAGRIISRFVKRPSRFISTTLIGNTLALVVYGIFMAKILEPYLISVLPGALNGEIYILIFQTAISTLLVLVTAEFLPKSLFMIDPNWMLRIFAIPMFFIYYLLSPLVWTVVSLSKGLYLLMGMKYEESEPVFKLTDLNHFILNLEGKNEEQEYEVDTKIFSNALEFKTIRVRECMVPRTEVTAVEVDSTLDEFKAAFIESGHSKILIYKQTIDDVVGYVHSLELFKKPESIEKILTPIIIVPETLLANELMVQFITEHKSIALVVDEFGGTSGIVTIEDVIEEIFGEIQDEHDVDELVEQKIDEANYLLSARHEIDYLNDKYDWNIPKGEFETLGGLILSITEDLPSQEQVVTSPPYQFTIVSMEDIRIDIVKLSILETDESLL